MVHLGCGEGCFAFMSALMKLVYGSAEELAAVTIAARCCWEGFGQSSAGAATKLVEEELPESQCGFRRGRSCADMIFTVYISWWKRHGNTVLRSS